MTNSNIFFYMTVEETRYLFLINNTIGEGDIYVIISVCLSTHVGFNENTQDLMKKYKKYYCQILDL